MKLFRLNKNTKQVKHIYTGIPKKIDSPGEEAKFQVFKRLVLEVLKIGVQYCVAKVANPIEKYKNLLLDNEIKRKQLEDMEDTAEMAVILEVEEEKKFPIDRESSEADKDRLITELLALEKELRVKYGVFIELRKVEESGEGNINEVRLDQQTGIVAGTINQNLDEAALNRIKGILEFIDGLDESSQTIE